jgi:hypothetical protein
MFYVSIAQDGYPPPRPDGGWVFHAAFFPLFPSLMRGLSELLGGLHVYLAGLLLAQVLLALAVVYLDKLVRLDADERTAELAVIAVLAYPGSHFLSAVYPESLALLLAVLAVYAARTARPALAAVTCALAVLARPDGWILCLPVLYEICMASGRPRLTPRVLWLVLPVLAAGLLMGLHAQLYADPLYFVHVEAGWNRKPSFPFAALFRLDVSPDYHLFALGALALLAYGVVRRARPGYLALAGVGLLLPLGTGTLRGIQRYLGHNFPFFTLLAAYLAPRPRLRRVLLVLGLTVLFIYAFRWAKGAHPN